MGVLLISRVLGEGLGILEEGLESGGSVGEVALEGIYVDILEGGELGVGLDAFGRDGHIEVVCEVGDELADGQAGGGEDVVDKGFIDFEGSEGELREGGEVGVSFAEVVESDLDAEVSQVGEFTDSAVEVLNAIGFGDFELELRGGEVCEVEGIGEGVDEVWRCELKGGEVDGEFEVWRQEVGVDGEGLASDFESPVVEGFDESGLFGDGDEGIWKGFGDRATRPSHEDFGAGDGEVGVDEGLVVEFKLTFIECGGHIAFKFLVVIVADFFGGIDADVGGILFF